jgi:hypothetical protein
MAMVEFCILAKIIDNNIELVTELKGSYMIEVLLIH